MITSLKNRFNQKLKKINASACFSLREEEWMHNLFIGNLKTKTFNLSMGESYEFQMVICACPDGKVIMEIIFEKRFEQEMIYQQMEPKLVRKVGSCNSKEEVFCQSTQSFYLEDLIIKNVDTGEIVKQMFGRDGNVSWELSGLSWELNITGIVAPATKSITTPAVSPPITGGISTTTVANVTNPVTYAAPPPPLPGVTATLPTIQQTVRAPGRQPPILGLIQQSLQNKAPNVHSVQYLTNSRAFNIPPPRFPAQSPARGNSPAIPTASTPKKKKSKSRGKFLKKIIPLPQETSEDEQTTSNYGEGAEGARQSHEYETLGEDSISEIEKEQVSPANVSNSVQYVPIDKVAGLVEQAVNKLLAEGVIVRATESSSESNEKTVVQVDNEQAEEIRNLSETIFQEQPAKESGEKQNKTNDESISEKGESANSNPGPETRSRSKGSSKGPE